MHHIASSSGGHTQRTKFPSSAPITTITYSLDSSSFTSLFWRPTIVSDPLLYHVVSTTQGSIEWLFPLPFWLFLSFWIPFLCCSLPTVCFRCYYRRPHRSMHPYESRRCALYVLLFCLLSNCEVIHRRLSSHNKLSSCTTQFLLLQLVFLPFSKRPLCYCLPRIEHLRFIVVSTIELIGPALVSLLQFVGSLTYVYCFISIHSDHHFNSSPHCFKRTLLPSKGERRIATVYCCK